MPRARYSGTEIDAFYSSFRALGSFSSVRNLQRYSGRSVSKVRKFQRPKDLSCQRRLDFVAIFIGSKDICAQTRKLS